MGLYEILKTKWTDQENGGVLPLHRKMAAGAAEEREMAEEPWPAGGRSHMLVERRPPGSSATALEGGPRRQPGAPAHAHAQAQAEEALRGGATDAPCKFLRRRACRGASSCRTSGPQREEAEGAPPPERSSSPLGHQRGRAQETSAAADHSIRTRAPRHRSFLPQRVSSDFHAPRC
jgi:hypothetical protein